LGRKSLPTEAEWQRAAYSTPNGVRDHIHGEFEAPSSEFGNFNFARWNPGPVNAFPSGESAFGVQGMLGNGWEWTSTEFFLSPDSNRFRSIADTRLISSMADTSS